MTAHHRVETMSDHRNLLPNLNCLGIWQVNEAGVYGSDGWIALRQELLRSPDTDAWHTLVVQSVVNYPSTDAAQRILHAVHGPLVEVHQPQRQHHAQRQAAAQVAKRRPDQDRCRVGHTVHQARADGVESCQRVLAVDTNVVIDVQACTRDASTVTKAAAVADAIEAKLPR